MSSGRLTPTICLQAALIGAEELSEGFQNIWARAKSIAGREGFLHWEVAFPGVWRNWQDSHPGGGFDAVIGNPPWDRIKLQEVEWFAIRDPEVARAPTAAARGAGIRRLRDQESPLADEFDAAKERADKLGKLIRKSRPLPTAGRRRYQSLLPVRRACHEPYQAGRVRWAAHSLRHLRRQDCSRLLQVRLHHWTSEWPIRL